MKVNLKKIGAIVAGATILASTAAFGALWYGNTQLVNENGAPVAKVVIGENAAASDGVGGGLIAGKMVGSSFKTVTLSGQLVGEPTCTAGGEGAGTCTISEEKAQIQITVPGALAEGTYTFGNLIGDFINRRLLDRIDNTPVSDAEYPMSTTDTSENANPFTDNQGAGLEGASETYLYRVTGDMFSPLATTTTKDEDVAKSYTEVQNLWLKGFNDYNKDENEITGTPQFLAYSIKYGGTTNDFGIPVCTTPTSGNYDYCKYGADAQFDYATEAHKVRTNFLGESWVISEMNPPDVDLTNENYLVDGGSIKLAKESVSGILNQGESLPVDSYKFHLDDLEAHGDTTSAIISVLDANDNILKKDKVAPGETKEMQIEGNTYRFHVYKVAPGYTFGAKWADVAIYSKELKLESGKELDEDQGNNPEYRVALGWKNKDAATTGTGCVLSSEAVEGRMCADHLRSIIIYAEDPSEFTSSGEDYLASGDYLPIVQDPVAWKLTYDGLDLTSADRSSLTFKLESSTHKQLPDALLFTGGWGGTGDGYYRCIVQAPYVKVTSSSTSSVFTIPAEDGTGVGAYTSFDFGVGLVPGETSAKEFYLAMGPDPLDPNFVGFACAFPLAAPTDVSDPTTYPLFFDESLVMKIPGSGDHYGFAQFSDNSNGATEFVEYEKIGDGDTSFIDGGVIAVKDLYNGWGAGADIISDGAATSGGGSWEAQLDPTAGSDDLDFMSSNPGVGGDTRFLFVLAEKAGEGTSDWAVDYWVFGYSDTTTPTFKYDSDAWDLFAGGPFPVTTDNGDEVFYVYTGPVKDWGTYGVKEDGFISERGTVFKSLDSDEVKFDMAHKLGHAQWTFASAAATGAAESTCVATLEEGKDYTCAGVNVKVIEITEKGVCGAGAATCTGSTTGMSAKVVDETGAEVTTAAVPYANAYSGLIILDRDAVGVGTLVSVGGDKVNTVTASLLEGSPVDWTTEKKIVREVVQGQKIVVAGAEAEDTLAAVNDFIAALRTA